jgi:hypothetical protein
LALARAFRHAMKARSSADDDASISAVATARVDAIGPDTVLCDG